MKSLFTVLALFAFACAPVTTTPGTQPSVSELHFTAARNASGVLLMLDNGTTSPVGYNLCTSELQRGSGSSWTAVPTDEVCTMQFMTLNPGHDATFQKRLPAGLPAGTYRYAARVESPLGSQMVTVYTDPFTL